MERNCKKIKLLNLNTTKSLEENFGLILGNADEEDTD